VYALGIDHLVLPLYFRPLLRFLTAVPRNSACCEGSFVSGLHIPTASIARQMRDLFFLMCPPTPGILPAIARQMRDFFLFNVPHPPPGILPAIARQFFFIMCPPSTGNSARNRARDAGQNQHLKILTPHSVLGPRADGPTVPGYVAPPPGTLPAIAGACPAHPQGKPGGKGETVA